MPLRPLRLLVPLIPLGCVAAFSRFASAAEPAGEKATTPTPPDAAGIAFFEEKIRPVLAEKCYECHSTAKKVKAKLHLDSREDWSKWLEAAGIPDAKTRHGPVLNRASMLIDAAVDGQGVALARTSLAAWDLINKRLVRPFAVSLPLSKTYWIVCPTATSALPKIATFRDWLMAEAADDKRRIDSLDR